MNLGRLLVKQKGCLNKVYSLFNTIKGAIIIFPQFRSKTDYANRCWL